MAAGEDYWLELQYLLSISFDQNKTQCNHHSASCLRLIADTPRSHSTYLLMHVIHHQFN